MDAERHFQGLLRNDKYQVFLFASRAHLPFFFATHSWLVINKKGIVSRFGVAWNKNARLIAAFGKLENQARWSHLYKNYLPPWQGIRIFPFSWNYFWEGRLLGHIDGGENSVAMRMADFIGQSGEIYPYKENYSLLGPNSNTYVQWVLNRFPESGLRLPWTAFGKHEII